MPWRHSNAVLDKVLIVTLSCELTVLNYWPTLHDWLCNICRLLIRHTTTRSCFEGQRNFIGKIIQSAQTHTCADCRFGVGSDFEKKVDGEVSYAGLAVCFKAPGRGEPSALIVTPCTGGALFLPRQIVARPPNTPHSRRRSVAPPPAESPMMTAESRMPLAPAPPSSDDNVSNVPIGGGRGGVAGGVDGSESDVALRLLVAALSAFRTTREASSSRTNDGILFALHDPAQSSPNECSFGAVQLHTQEPRPPPF